jgi:radical SAM superfamily enzyme YgiQ (UPF0313 family)
MIGEPGEEIVDIIRSQHKGNVFTKPMNLRTLPSLNTLYPKPQMVDFVMTSFGCFHNCAFCLAQKFYRRIGQSTTRYIDLHTVIQDLVQRPNNEIYLTDLDFSATSTKRLETFIRLLSTNEMAKTFTIESRVDSLTEEKADMWVKLGVKRVKLGVEGGTDKLIRSFAKGTDVHQARRAVEILKERGIAVVVYLVVGGKATAENYHRTREYVRELNPEFVAVNVWAYDLNVDYRYDTQFSPVSLARWNIDPEEFFKHIELQKEINPTVGKMLNVSS